MEQKQHDEQNTQLEDLVAPVHELTEAEAAQVEGGARVEIGALKAGSPETQYLKIKLSDILISS